MCQFDKIIERVESEMFCKGGNMPKEGVIIVDSIDEFMQSNHAVHLKDLDMKLMQHRAVSVSDG